MSWGYSQMRYEKSIFLVAYFWCCWFPFIYLLRVNRSSCCCSCFIFYQSIMLLMLLMLLLLILAREGEGLPFALLLLFYFNISLFYVKESIEQNMYSWFGRSYTKFFLILYVHLFTYLNIFILQFCYVLHQYFRLRASKTTIVYLSK